MSRKPITTFLDSSQSFPCVTNDYSRGSAAQLGGRKSTYLLKAPTEGRVGRVTTQQLRRERGDEVREALNANQFDPK
jgi:hypothetical protein